VFYVVNKIDGPKHEDRALDFYGLGVDPLYSVSAEERYGVGDLMDDVVKVLPKATEEALDQEATKVAVVGRPNVGKSSLINQFLGYKRVIVDEARGPREMPSIRCSRRTGKGTFSLIRPVFGGRTGSVCG